MVVDHAGSLHCGIQYGGPNEGESAFFHILAETIGNRAVDGYTGRRRPAILHRFAVHEIPDIAGEAAAVLLDPQKGLSVLSRAKNLQTVANNLRVLEQFFQFFIAVAGNFLCIEIIECLTITLAFAQHRDPGEARLCAFQ